MTTRKIKIIELVGEEKANAIMQILESSYDKYRKSDKGKEVRKNANVKWLEKKKNEIELENEKIQSVVADHVEKIRATLTEPTSFLAKELQVLENHINKQLTQVKYRKALDLLVENGKVEHRDSISRHGRSAYKAKAYCLFPIN